MVNDEPTQLLRTGKILRKQNLEVETFSGVLALISYLEQGGAMDLVVTDIHMRDIDGWKLCRLLRSQDFQAFNHVPILATSAVFCGEEARNLTSGLGADALLSVPFTSTELIRCVGTLLNGEVPSIKTRVLISPTNADSIRGLAECFRRFGYEVHQQGEPESAIQILEKWKPQVVIIWHDQDPEFLRRVLEQHRIDGAFVANIVVLDDTFEGSQISLLSRGADACVKADVEADSVVSLAEKISRVKALFHFQDEVEGRQTELSSMAQSFYTLLESVPNPMLLCDPKGLLKTVNGACSKLLGSEPSRVIGRCITEILAPKQPETTILNMTSGPSFEAVLTTSDGHALEVTVHPSALYYQGVASTALCIQTLSPSQEGILAVGKLDRTTETEFRPYTSSSYDWEFWRSPVGHFLYSSPTCKKITGYEPYEFEMDTDFLHRIAHPDDVHRVPGPDEEAAEEYSEAEFRIFDRSGSLLWLAYKARPVFDDNGNYLGSRGAIRDLTLHRELENEKDRLIAAVEQFTNGIAITDLEGKLEYVNSTFESTCAFDGGNQVGALYDVVNEPGVSEAVCRGTTWSGTKTRESGEVTLTMEITMSPVRGRDGIINSLVWSERNVTAELEMQERMMQAQRMEAIGTLAGGVAHDFNNLLSGILGYSSLLRMEPMSWKETQQAAEVIERAARRAADLTQKLLGFARQGKHKDERFCIHDSVSEVLTLLTRTTDPSISMEAELDAHNPWMCGDSGQIGQVLLNMAINAIHAIEGQGNLTIYTRNVKASEVPSNPGKHSPTSEYIEVKIADSGCGIPEEKLQRIFEPFFTTKESGSGLGLAMVYGIVQNHCGLVEVSSEVGRGTVFTLYFPCCRQPDKCHQHQTIGTVKRAKGRVLLVDDEEIVRNIAFKMLTRIGYEVVLTSDGQEAVDFYQDHHEEIDLVVVDMLMPRMNGRDCFRRLREINPQVRAILSTGYSHNQSIQEVLDEGLLAYISKPFDLQEIASVVGSVLVEGDHATKELEVNSRLPRPDLSTLAHDVS